MIFVICFINRSGSNYLCDLLHSVGIGQPREYYFPHKFEERCLEWRVPTSSPKDYFDEICRRQGAIRGIKIEWNGFEQLRNEVDIETLNPKYILLTRNDKVRQAVSWLRAEATGKWTSDASAVNEDWKYDRHELEEKIRLIGVLENRWRIFFRGKTCLQISYEELNPAIVYRIAGYLGVQWDAQLLQPRSRRKVQSDRYTEEILKRYGKSSMHDR